MKKKIRYPNEEDTAFYDRITKIECTIMDKIAVMKKNKNLPICSHFLQLEEFPENFHKNVNYYDKFWKLYLTSELCKSRNQQLEDTIGQFQKELVTIQNLIEKRQSELSTRIKRKLRRKAQQIEKSFSCSHLNCFREYGSQISLKLHMKLKHANEINSVINSEKVIDEVYEDKE